MTLLLSWIGKDSRKISSAYIASDSRFSWSDGRKFDYGRKVYALQNSPDILGYCGDVLYPTVILTQLLDMDKDSILFPKNSSNRERVQIVFNQIKEKSAYYPESKLAKSIEIIHISRDNEIDFVCFIYKWTIETNWTISEQEIPLASDKVIILGSGKDEFYNRYLDYLKGNNGKTSRALFQCLCHTLIDIKDLQCGGAPQLVGLYNKFNGKNFGIIYKNQRYYLGTKIHKLEETSNLEWRNELFERYNGITKQILEGAQRQPNDLNI
ncbi:hypothetical protein [Chryseobacterium paridis]|uniref:Uncharacterized protein n=1 Tax=Chryseobacterium paridis TaxID=2800328 RepID=A0ABS1FS18_9FLAO|nr:hypothetical protein [Chryseobacterium paridis]MBK1895227.1 hypothetical protein [Chryseobacterium paridis]